MRSGREWAGRAKPITVARAGTGSRWLLVVEPLSIGRPRLGGISEVAGGGAKPALLTWRCDGTRWTGKRFFAP